MAASTAPTGLARRGRRLSDQETEQRMLQAAVRMVSRAGLTVSLDHISLEEVIRAAGVSRSTVYRRWPHKDLFFSDLVKELARSATPTILAEEVALIREVFAERPDWLESAAWRQALVAELFRRLSLLDFQSLSGSAEWRTYVALHATFMSLADDEAERAGTGRARRIRARPPQQSGECMGATGRLARLPAAARAGNNFRRPSCVARCHHARPRHHGAVAT